MMCGKKEEEQGDCSQSIIHNIQNYQEQLFLQQMQQQQQQQQNMVSLSPILPWSHSFNPAREPDPFFLPPPTPSPYGGLFNRRAPSLQFAYDGLSISDALGQVVQPGSAPFGLEAELGKMTGQEIMDAKALAASKSHSEAERRRRERINNHLAKLRSLLPSTTKVSTNFVL